MDLVNRDTASKKIGSEEERKKRVTTFSCIYYSCICNFLNSCIYIFFCKMAVQVIYPWISECKGRVRGGLYNNKIFEHVLMLIKVSSREIDIKNT